MGNCTKLPYIPPIEYLYPEDKCDDLDFNSICMYGNRAYLYNKDALKESAKEVKLEGHATQLRTAIKDYIAHLMDSVLPQHLLADAIIMLNVAEILCAGLKAMKFKDTAHHTLA